MTPLRTGALVATLVGVALWSLARAVRRAPSSISAARVRMLGADAPPMVRSHDGVVALGGWIEQWVVRRYGSGLVSVGLSASAVVTRVVVALVTVGLAVLAGVVTLAACGVLPPSPWWAILAPLGGAVAAWTMLVDVGSRITRRRRELRQSTNEFVQLVAVGLTTDQSVEEAIAFALDVAGGPSASLLRDAVATAPLRGLPVWEALDDVGTQYDVRELCEFASSVERQGLQGVAIGTTVATLAASMRAKGLDQLERDADRANANLAGPTIGFVVTTIVFLAYPLALRISEAFGG